MDGDSQEEIDKVTLPSSMLIANGHSSSDGHIRRRVDLHTGTAVPAVLPCYLHRFIKVHFSTRHSKLLNMFRKMFAWIAKPTDRLSDETLQVNMDALLSWPDL